MEIDLALVVAVLSVLVGLLCLGLFVTALLRAGKAKRAGGTVAGETASELRVFARNQFLSAVVMFALAAVIVYFN